LPRDQFTNVLVGWEGYPVELVERGEPAEKGGRARVEITLTRDKPTFRCSGCDLETTQVHEMIIRCVRDLAILDADAYVWVPAIASPAPRAGPSWRTCRGSRPGLG
jgi:hypothetical protein